MGYVINIDTGGTFTDGYVTGPAGSIRAKVDTTPHDLTVGILACIDRAASLLEMSRPELLRQTDAVRFSTTIGTNTLINRSGPKIGLLLGETLGDPLMAELAAELPLDRELVQLVPETEQDGARVIAAVHTLLERGARILVVALSSGADLPAREGALRSRIAADYPRHYLGAVPVLASHQVTLAPDPRVRAQTAVLNAYLHPGMSRVLYRVEVQLRTDGYRHPLLVANADAGTSRVAKTTALRTWGSGPAGGVAGALELTRELGLPHVVTLDVGGTSSDISVIEQSGWRYAVQPLIEGIEVALPAVALESVGIGGGSIARVEDGRVRVGPESMGAQPGPAAFGLGGQEATVTDAACCLGIFDPDHFLGGRKRLDVEAAGDIVGARVAEPLGVGVTKAAARILETAADGIAQVIDQQLRRQGLVSSEAALFASGGAGGLLAHAVADRAGLAAVYGFTVNSVFSAFGLSRLDISHSYEALPGTSLGGDLAGLRERARRDMQGEGIDTSAISYAIEGEVVGSDGDVRVVALGNNTDAAVAAAGALHNGQLRLARLRATSAGVRGALPLADGASLATRGQRALHLGDRVATLPVFDWDTGAAGAELHGPAILESAETTLLIPPGARGRIGALGEIVLPLADSSQP